MRRRRSRVEGAARALPEAVAALSRCLPAGPSPEVFRRAKFDRSSVLKSKCLECRFCSFHYTVDYFVQIDSTDRILFHDLSLNKSQKTCLPFSFPTKKCSIQLHTHRNKTILICTGHTMASQMVTGAKPSPFFGKCCRIAFILCSSTSLNHWPVLTQNVPGLVLKWK